jgi:hypothetical protein
LHIQMSLCICICSIRVPGVLYPKPSSPCFQWYNPGLYTC